MGYQDQWVYISPADVAVVLRIFNPLIDCGYTATIVSLLTEKDWRLLPLKLVLDKT